MEEENFFVVSEDDEDILEYVHMINRPRRARLVRERPNHFEKWDDQDFFARFRLSKQTVRRLVTEIEEDIASPTDRYVPL